MMLEKVLLDLGRDIEKVEDTVNMNELNVERIMEEIRSEIKEKGYTNDMLSFSDVLPGEIGVNVEKFERVRFNEELFNLNTIWNVNPNRPIEKKAGIKGKCITIFKKIIRKCIRFYLSPIVQEQDSFNAVSVRLFNMLNLYMEENAMLLEEVSRLKIEQENLKNQVHQLCEKSA